MYVRLYLAAVKTQIFICFFLVVLEGVSKHHVFPFSEWNSSIRLGAHA